MESFIQLVAQGIPRFCVRVLPAQDSETMAGPLSELITHLQLCLERTVTWYRREQAAQCPVRMTLHLYPERELDRETFEIIADAQGVELAASTLTALGHAVHYFLEQAFGVRWLWPGPSGTVTPHLLEVTWPIGIQRHSPAWAWRRLWLGGAFWGEQDPFLAELSRAGVAPATLTELRRWQERNRLGGLNIADGHRWCQICPPERYGASHPEYFALVNGQRDARPFNGKHRNQPCTSNPNVVRLVAESILAQFGVRSDLDGYSLSINDGAGFCECPQCRALDKDAPAAQAESVFDRTTREVAGSAPHSITARMFHFANQVAEQVGRVCPDKFLLLLVYSAYRTPPLSVRLRPNVIAQFCAMSWAHASETARSADEKLLQGLIPVTTRRGIYDYFINGAFGSLPRGFARVFSKSLDTYHKAGCRYFATQAGLDFAVNGFNYYLAARRLWDMTPTADEVLNDYCRSGFGAGADIIRRYLNAFLECWEECRGQSEALEDAAGILYPQSWRMERRHELKQAEAACAADLAARDRVRFLREGLDFIDVLVETCAAISELKRRGAPAGKPVDEAALRQWVRTCPDKPLVKQTLQARRHLFQWVAAHQDGFYVAAMWFNYQYQFRSGLLGAWMDCIEKAIQKS